jgi:hypothetical protein
MPRGCGSSGVSCRPAKAGLGANEARYFTNKYDHVFTVEPARNATTAIDWVHRILAEERTSGSPTSSTRAACRST